MFNDEDLNKTWDQIQSEIDARHDGKLSPDYKPHAYKLDAVRMTDVIAEMVIPPESIPLADFPQFTRIFGGFRPREFTILCGSTGSGKTTLCANIALDLIKQKTPFFVASVETGHNDFVRRCVSAHVNEDWNTGDPVEQEKVLEFFKNSGELFTKSNMHLSLYEDRFSVDTLIKDIRYHVENFGCKVAIVDNLNFFMEVTSAQQANAEMDRVIHDLIIFCKQVDVHIIMVMHPKKTEGTRVMSEFDIKGSSTAVQEAHNVWLFNRPEPGSNVNKFSRELKFAKMRRRGKYGGFTLVFDTKNGVKYSELGVLE